jgi:hypothetical protein
LRVDGTTSTPPSNKFFSKNPLLLDPSSTQYPDDGNAANTHTHNYPWPPIVRSFFSSACSIEAVARRNSAQSADTTTQAQTT